MEIIWDSKHIQIPVMIATATTTIARIIQRLATITTTATRPLPITSTINATKPESIGKYRKCFRIFRIHSSLRHSIAGRLSAVGSTYTIVESQPGRYRGHSPGNFHIFSTFTRNGNARIEPRPPPPRLCDGSQRAISD